MLPDNWKSTGIMKIYKRKTKENKKAKQKQTSKKIPQK